VTVALDEYGDPKAELSTERTNSNITNHFDAAFKLDGSLNIQAYSSKGRAISGNDGEIALITIQIASNIQLGTYPLLLKNIAISDVNSVTYTVDLVETSIEITGASDSRIILDETSTTAPKASDGAVDVLVKRTIKANEWSTICLPFDMTEAQVAAAFGDNVQLADFKGYNVTEEGEDVVGITVNFDNVTAIEANHPYIIKVNNAIAEFTVDGVNIAPDDAPCVSFGYETGRPKVYHPMDFIGTYVADFDFYHDALSRALFLSGNKFYYATENTRHMKAFRAYFDFDDVLSEVAGAGARISMNFDEMTGISDNNREAITNNRYYDLQGRRVEKPSKGLYIRNGKKEIVK